MRNERRNTINKQLKALFNSKKVTFINSDFGDMSGVIHILGDNRAYPTIMSKIVEIDNLLTDLIDGDILDTNIHITFDGVADTVRVKITFDFEC